MQPEDVGRACALYLFQLTSATLGFGLKVEGEKVTSLIVPTAERIGLAAIISGRLSRFLAGRKLSVCGLFDSVATSDDLLCAA